MREFDFGASLDIGKTLDAQRKEKEKEAPAERAASGETPDKATVKPVTRHAPKATDLAKSRAVRPVKILREREDDTDVVVTSTTVPLDTPEQRARDSPAFRWWALVLVFLVVGGAAWMTLTRTAYLPQLDARAAALADNDAVRQAIAETKAAYPYISDAGLEREVNARLAELRASPAYAARVAQDVESLKSLYAQGSADTLQPFLYKADTYLYYRMARNIVETGSEAPIDSAGRKHDWLRIAPYGVSVDLNWWPKILAAYHRFNNRFAGQSAGYASDGLLGVALASSSTLLESLFFLPAVIGTLAALLFVLLVLRLTRSLAIAGIAGVLFAVHPLFFLGTFAGNTDTQSPAIMLSIAAVLFAVCACTACSWRPRAAYAVAFAASLWVFSNIWQGWPYILIVLCMFAAVFGFFRILRVVVFRRERWSYGTLAGFVAACALAAYWLLGTQFVQRAEWYLTGRTLNAVYPSLIGSISELQRTPFPVLVNFLGGYVMLLSLAATLAYLAYRGLRRLSPPPALLLAACWFVPVFIATLLARRFSFYLAAPALFLFALGLHAVWPALCRIPAAVHFRLPRWGTQCVVAVVILSVFLPPFLPYWAQTSMLPAVTAAHTDVGLFFEREVNGSAIIDAWWDEGYVWQAVAGKATLWDNAAFDNAHSYWFPRAMVSTSLVESEAILRMENCGTIHAALDAFGDETTLLRAAINRSSAVAMARDNGLPQSAIDLTDCSPQPAYLVITEDAFQKLPQMMALASWSLVDGAMIEATAGLDMDNATRVLSSRFNLSESDARLKLLSLADSHVREAGINVSNVAYCSSAGSGLLACTNFLVNLSSMDAVQNGLRPSGLAVVEGGVRRVRKYADAKSDFSVLVIKDVNGSYWSALVDDAALDMTLVRLFSGESVPQFEKVFEARLPQRITVHRVVHGWQSAAKNSVPANVALPPMVKNGSGAPADVLNESIAESLFPAKSGVSKNSSLHSILLQGISP